MFPCSVSSLIDRNVFLHIFYVVQTAMLSLIFLKKVLTSLIMHFHAMVTCDCVAGILAPFLVRTAG